MEDRNRHSRRQAKRSSSRTLHPRRRAQGWAVYYHYYCPSIEWPNNVAFGSGSRVGLWFEFFVK